MACNFKCGSGEFGILVQLVNAALSEHCSCNEISGSILMLYPMRDETVELDG